MSNPKKVEKDKKTPSPAPSPSQQQSIEAMLTQDMMRDWLLSIQNMISTGFAQVKSELLQIKEQMKDQEKNLSGQIVEVRQQVIEKWQK